MVEQPDVCCWPAVGVLPQHDHNGGQLLLHPSVPGHLEHCMGVISHIIIWKAVYAEVQTTVHAAYLGLHGGPYCRHASATSVTEDEPFDLRGCAYQVSRY